MKRLIAAWLLAVTTLAVAAPGPYDELADAREMRDQGIHDFFVKVAARGR